jgi:DNA-binding beta-propeller fold protein YncE
MRIFLCLWSSLWFGAAILPAQQTSVPTALPSSPFVIRDTWVIGGQGSWNLLAMDATARRLYIAHGTAVQVVDVQTGALAGTIGGFTDARDIALDPGGTVGYISDGPRARVIVFDRTTLHKIAEIPTDPSPSALVIEPSTGLLFAVCSAPLATPASGRNTRNTAPQPPARAQSSITVIDPQTRTAIGSVQMPVTLGFAQPGGSGEIYIDAPQSDQVLRLDAQSAASQIRDEIQSEAAAKAQAAKTAPREPAEPSAWPVINWTTSTATDGQLNAVNLGRACPDPSGLAVDSADQRLFVTCGNMQMAVVNSGTGEIVTTLPVGPGADGTAWDAGQGLIYVANSGGDGSLTIIRRDVTDTYSVIQTLPTRRQARTMAIDTSAGTVYLVTEYTGVDRGATGGFGALKAVPVNGSFQVLAIARQ